MLTRHATDAGRRRWSPVNVTGRRWTLIEVFTVTCRRTAASRLTAPIRSAGNRIHRRTAAARLIALADWACRKPGPATALVRQLPPPVIGSYSTGLTFGPPARGRPRGRRRGAHRHHRVVDELLDGAAEALDLGAQPCVVWAQRRCHVFGVGVVGAGGETDQVAEEHGHDLALRFEATNVLLSPSTAAPQKRWSGAFSAPQPGQTHMAAV